LQRTAAHRVVNALEAATMIKEDVNFDMLVDRDLLSLDLFRLNGKTKT
jgi:hypothetical protein